MQKKELKRLQEENDAELTIKELGAQYIERHAKVKKKSWQEDQASLGDVEGLSHGCCFFEGVTTYEKKSCGICEHFFTMGTPVYFFLPIHRGFFSFCLYPTNCLNCQ